MSEAGARVRDLRLQRGLSQEQIGGGRYSASYISLIESGARPATRRALTVIAQALDTTIEHLETGRVPGTHARLELAIRHLAYALDRGDLSTAEIAGTTLLAEQLAPHQRLRAEALLADTYERLGKLAEAIQTYERLVVASCDPDSPISSLRCAIALSRCYRESGDLDEAVHAAETALHGAEAGLLTEAHIELSSTLACAHIERGDLTKAQLILERALGAATALDSRRARGAALWNLSLLAEERNDLALAIELADRALALFSEDDDIRNIARLRNSLAGVLLNADPPELSRAVELLNQAKEQLETAGSVVDIAYCNTELAKAWLLKGQPKKAIKAAREALAVLHEDFLESARALLVSAQAWRELGDRDASIEAQRMAGEALERVGATRQAAKTWAELGAHQEAGGDVMAAMLSYKRASKVSGLTRSTESVRSP